MLCLLRSNSIADHIDHKGTCNVLPKRGKPLAWDAGQSPNHIQCPCAEGCFLSVPLTSGRISPPLPTKLHSLAALSAEMCLPQFDSERNEQEQPAIARGTLNSLNRSRPGRSHRRELQVSWPNSRKRGRKSGHIDQ